MVPTLLHVVVASFNSSLSHCCLIFMNFFYQFPEQNLYWNIPPLRSAQIFLSNESLFAQNWFRTRELCPFHPSAAICSEFQNAQRPKFLPYLLVRVFKFIDLECVGMEIWWSFWISTFCFLYSSEHILKLMKTAACFRTLEMFTNLIFFFDHEFMGMLCHACKTIQVHNLPPRWQSGVETIANKPTIPKISKCGRASLAKK